MPNELHLAASDKTGFSKVKELLENNPSLLDELHTECGTRAVDFAAQSGSLDTLIYLLNHNANIDASHQKYNLLFWATDNTPDVLEYIANPNNKLIEQFNDGTTYFHAAIAAGYAKDVKQQLTENPTLAYLENEKSQSPFYWALMHKNDNIIEQLISVLGDSILSQDSHWKDCLNKLFTLVINPVDADYFLELFEKIKVYCEILLLENEKNQTANYFSIRINFQIAWLYLTKEDYQTAKEQLARIIEQLTIHGDTFPKNKAEELIEGVNRCQNDIHLKEQAKFRGLKCKPCSMKANSFYTTMVDQLHALNDSAYENITVDNLRAITCDHLVKNKALYQDFIWGGIEEYLKDVQNPKISPDQLVIMALSREFNMTFYILNSNGSAPEIIKPSNPRATLKFAYLEQYCYYPLEVEASDKPELSIEHEIEKAAPDYFEGGIISAFSPSIIKVSEEINECESNGRTKKSVRPQRTTFFANLSSSASIADDEAMVCEEQKPVFESKI